jgi:hypothetical protein
MLQVPGSESPGGGRGRRGDLRTKGHTLNVHKMILDPISEPEGIVHGPDTGVLVMLCGNLGFNENYFAQDVARWCGLLGRLELREGVLGEVSVRTLPMGEREIHIGFTWRRGGGKGEGGRRGERRVRTWWRGITRYRQLQKREMKSLAEVQKMEVGRHP